MRLILVQPELRHDAGTSNLETIRWLLDAARVDFDSEDVLLLPERFDLREPQTATSFLKRFGLWRVCFGSATPEAERHAACGLLGCLS